MATQVQPVVFMAPTAPIVLNILDDGMTLNMTTGGSAGAVTSVNTRTGAVTVVASFAIQLTFGTLIAVDASIGNSYSITLTSSSGVIGTPTNPTDGQVIRFRLTQGPGGNFTVAFSGGYDFGTFAVPTLSTVAGKVDILGFEYVASISKWCFLGSGIGY